MLTLSTNHFRATKLNLISELTSACCRVRNCRQKEAVFAPKLIWIGVCKQVVINICIGNALPNECDPSSKLVKTIVEPRREQISGVVEIAVLDKLLNAAKNKCKMDYRVLSFLVPRIVLGSCLKGVQNRVGYFGETTKPTWPFVPNSRYFQTIWEGLNKHISKVPIFSRLLGNPHLLNSVNCRHDRCEPGEKCLPAIQPCIPWKIATFHGNANQNTGCKRNNSERQPGKVLSTFQVTTPKENQLYEFTEYSVFY